MNRAANTGVSDAVQTLNTCLRQTVQLSASDLHLKAGAPPCLRLNGELVSIPGMYALSSEDMDLIVRELTHMTPSRFTEFEAHGEADLAYEVRGVGRFRVNIFRQRNEISIALRVIPDKVPTLATTNLPPVIEQLATTARGLILITGATGSGKTTTLAAIIDQINSASAKHIITVEDPIEVVHRDKKSLVNQREVGIDTDSFSSALRRALRQDPDVILIGEMRDEETVRTALAAAETGHLVLSTLHTIDVMETIYRVLDFFPADLERQARNMLASTLRGIVSQRLVRTADGRSRVPAVEVLVGTRRIADCIAKPEETERIPDAVAEGSYYGMQTFDQALLQLVLDHAITIEEAMYHASSKQNFALLLEANSVHIDRDLRRIASGNVNSPQEELEIDEARRKQYPSAPLPNGVSGAPAGAAGAGAPGGAGAQLGGAPAGQSQPAMPQPGGYGQPPLQFSNVAGVPPQGHPHHGAGPQQGRGNAA